MNRQIIPHNSFVGSPLHRADVRFQQRIKLVGRRSVDGILEVFNLLDHANYGSFTTAVDNVKYGQPVYNADTAYAARAAQSGFRFAF